MPKPYGDYLILDILKKSKGTAIAATDEEILEATRHWAKVEGIFAAPEGAASLVAYRKLRANGFFQARRHSSPVQHRQRPEVSGCSRRECCEDSPRSRTAEARGTPNRRNHRTVLNGLFMAVIFIAVILSEVLRERSERNARSRRISTCDVASALGASVTSVSSVVKMSFPMTDRLYYHDSFLYDFDAEVRDVV